MKEVVANTMPYHIMPYCICRQVFVNLFHVSEVCPAIICRFTSSQCQLQMSWRHSLQDRTNASKQYGFLPKDLETVTWSCLQQDNYIAIGAFVGRDGSELPVAFLIAQASRLQETQVGVNSLIWRPNLTDKRPVSFSIPWPKLRLGIVHINNRR